MKLQLKKFVLPIVTSLIVIAIIAVLTTVKHMPAQAPNFHGAPPEAATLVNPETGPQNAAAGKLLYAQRCAGCHGPSAQGVANIPALATGATQSARPGQVFWVITHGILSNGMPAWNNLSEAQRWQIVTYLKTLHPPTASTTAPTQRQ